MTRLAPARDLPLDFLRGVDVMLMLLVNFLVPAAPAILRHAAWHGLTLADIVFPIFLFIVGISASLAFDGRLRRQMPWGAIARRGALLFAIGRSEEHTSELQSLMRISYAVFCLK